MDLFPAVILLVAVVVSTNGFTGSETRTGSNLPQNSRIRNCTELYGPRALKNPEFTIEGTALSDSEDSSIYVPVGWGSIYEQASQGNAESVKVNVFFRGEFGYELMVAIPYAYFHFLSGTLHSTVSCGDKSGTLLYWFSPNHAVDSKCVRNDFKNRLKPYGWNRGLHKSKIPLSWFPPPFAAHFRELGKVWLAVKAGSQLVVISNKISDEWKRGPINFLDLIELRHMIRRFVEAGFYVVYNRPGDAIIEDGWQGDSNSFQFDDYKLVRKLYGKDIYKGKVLLMQDIHAVNSGLSFNEVQLRMMARSRCFISVQGGNSILSSYFGGRNVIYARAGFEVDFHAYSKLYSRLSGAHIISTGNYAELRSLKEDMIRERNCAAV